MAVFIKNIANPVKIIQSEAPDKFTIYVIEVTGGQYSWTVKRRYSEFFDLNEKLVSAYNLDKNLLPPKKVFGSQSASFVQKRMKDLEIYLVGVLNCLPTMPPELCTFLDFQHYEIGGIAEALSCMLFEKGDQLLQSEIPFCISPLQLHAICERLKRGLPPEVSKTDVRKDLGHTLDFFTNVKYLKVVGSYEQHQTSNIQANDLPCDFSHFKSLKTLVLDTCAIKQFSGLETLKQNLRKLHIHNCISSMKEVLLHDLQFWQKEEKTVLVPTWKLHVADFSHNKLSKIDESIKLVPHVEYLDLSHNLLEDISNLQFLSSLVTLDLSNNKLTEIADFHTKLGNIKTLRLANNRISSLTGISKLYSLQILDLTSNDISELPELKLFGALPCLDNLVLTNNPITTHLEYRISVLQMFGDRVSELTLDNEPASQPEIDKVAVLLAIRKSTELAHPDISKISLARTFSKSNAMNSEAATDTVDNDDNSEVTEVR